MLITIEEGGKAEVQRIERFLLAHPGIIEAKVWHKNDQTIASVTLASEAQFSSCDLKYSCCRELGEKNTPDLIIIQKALRPAA